MNSLIYLSLTVLTNTLVVLWIVFQADQMHGAELDDALLRRFQNEAPIAWQKQIQQHENFFSTTPGVAINSSLKVVEEGNVSQIDEYQEKRIGTSCRLLISKNVMTGERTVECGNPRYAFELKSSTSGDWVVTGIYAKRVPLSDGRDIAHDYNRIMQPLAKIRPQTVPIEGVLNKVGWLSEETRIRGIKSISVNNRECVEVSIEFPFNRYKRDADGKAGLTVEQHSAVGVFDPVKEWVLLSFEWIGAPGFKTKNEFSFDEDIGGFPFETSSQMEVRNLTADTIKLSTTFQSSGEVAVLSEQEFTLTSFGFPEPSIGLGPPYWLYSSLGGLVLLVVGAVLYKWGTGLRRH